MCPSSFHMHPAFSHIMNIYHFKIPKCERYSAVSDSLQPMDYIVHGILQARILEWVAVFFSRGSSQLRNWTRVSCIADFLPAKQGPKATGILITKNTLLLLLLSHFWFINAISLPQGGCSYRLVNKLEGLLLLLLSCFSRVRLCATP